MQGKKEKEEENNFLIVGSNIPCSHFFFSDEYAEPNKRENVTRMTFNNFQIFSLKKQTFYFKGNYKTKRKVMNTFSIQICHE